VIYDGVMTLSKRRPIRPEFQFPKCSQFAAPWLTRHGLDEAKAARSTDLRAPSRGLGRGMSASLPSLVLSSR
jgi:hypothetical protein